MSTKRMLHGFAVLMLALAATAGTAQAAATLHASVVGPVVIGDQVFAGGTLVLRPVGGGSLVQVLIDGRAVASLFREGCGTASSSTSSRLVLREDGRGLTHLVGVRHTSSDSGHETHQPLRVAAVAEGLVTVPPYDPAAARNEARAAR